jgi:hypothetical protein
MSDRYVFGLIDPRDHRIFHVGTLEQEVNLNEHLADAVAEAMAGTTTPVAERVRAILAADFETPHAVILQPSASEADAVHWIDVLATAGNRLASD